MSSIAKKQLISTDTLIHLAAGNINYVVYVNHKSEWKFWTW